ncbi:hypothetical protein LGH83_13990 [Lichenihabitans sp. PAMC28606]|uniref:hypothetical protein n=1 Tax=Lichenihabitans sp. PAMC28606 TaxID=2880932 RepID=UPI001D0AE7B4|nr:hypothetical protein [Lichenihabitans sp. PAMC28606]UDL93671.1 hypothetical protein LGH83_13990 [Lichenihabitans sp. PAMC28606]
MSSDQHAFDFANITLADLDRLDSTAINDLPFGVVGLSPEGLVKVYSQTESRAAGLSLDSVLNTHYFATIAQCMNNFMVAQKFEDEATLDTMLDYVLTLRMRPTPVKLRLLKGSDASLSYILILRSR